MYTEAAQRNLNASLLVYFLKAISFSCKWQIIVRKFAYYLQCTSNRKHLYTIFCNTFISPWYKCKVQKFSKNIKLRDSKNTGYVNINSGARQRWKVSSSQFYNSRAWNSKGTIEVHLYNTWKSTF